MARDPGSILLPLGLAAGAGFVVWKLLSKSGGSVAAQAPGASVAPAGSGVLLPQYQPAEPYDFNIDWSNVGGSLVGPMATPNSSSGASNSSVATPLGPVSPPTWYQSSGGQGQGALLGFGAYGAASSDPRPIGWMQLAEMVSAAQGRVDSAWANYSSSFLNRVCAGAGFCPAYQSTADLVSSTDALAAGLVGLAQELAVNPDATYDNGQKKSAVFESTASSFVGNVSSIVTQLGDNSWTAALKADLIRLPQSIRDVLSWTVDTAGNVVKQIGWSAAETVLILGGAAAAVFWLLKKSGARVRGGPIEIG